MTEPVDHRASWVPNDDGDLVPRRTRGSVAHGFSKDDFTLVCHECGDNFGDEPDLPVGVIGAHFEKHHAGAKVQLDMLWLGQGPAPRERP